MVMHSLRAVVPVCDLCNMFVSCDFNNFSYTVCLGVLCFQPFWCIHAEQATFTLGLPGVSLVANWLQKLICKSTVLCNYLLRWKVTKNRASIVQFSYVWPNKQQESGFTTAYKRGFSAWTTVTFYWQQLVCYCQNHLASAEKKVMWKNYKNYRHFMQTWCYTHS